MILLKILGFVLQVFWNTKYASHYLNSVCDTMVSIFQRVSFCFAICFSAPNYFCCPRLKDFFKDKEKQPALSLSVSEKSDVFKGYIRPKSCLFFMNCLCLTPMQATTQEDMVIAATINNIIAFNLQAFASLDLNGDGVLSRNEIETADWNQLREYGNEVIICKLGKIVVGSSGHRLIWWG